MTDDLRALALAERVRLKLRDVREHPWTNGTAESLHGLAESRLGFAVQDLRHEANQLDLVGRFVRCRARVEIGHIAQALGVE